MRSELSNNDIKETKSRSEESYRNIRPEKEMTQKELNDAVHSEYNKYIDEEKEFYDDNGNKYRVGDELLPDKEIEKNGYKYKTDDKGRVVSAEGKLQVRDHSDRNPISESKEAVGKGEMRDSDDRGHLIGDRFNGSGGLENLVPMDRSINRGDYNKMEKTLDSAVKDGANVYYKVEPVYSGDSVRPSAFRASYTIDGEKTVVTFKNDSGRK